MSHKFLDELFIRVQAGAGGAGCVSFRREKYIPRGGPDGGDGGNGGSVYLKADHRILTLSHLITDKIYRASHGQPGHGQQKTGKMGDHLTLKVPLGTQIFDPDSHELLYDFTKESELLLTEGGQGGKGNTYFKNSIRQSPDYAQPGKATEEKSFLLSLKLIADAGLVGLPNAGKSTLLKALTNAKPKIGDYAFTTLSPNLGYINYDHIKKILIADIPGILKGASQGHGLGLSFLKHIERVQLLIFVLDINTAAIEDELALLWQELKAYSTKLAQKPYLIVINKVDCIEDQDFLEEWISNMKEDRGKIISISALQRVGIDGLKDKIRTII